MPEPSSFNWLEFITNFGPSAFFVVLLIRMISKDVNRNTIAVNKAYSMMKANREDIRAIAAAIEANNASKDK